MSTKNSPSSGSSFEQAGRKQTNLPVLVVIFLGLHAVVLGGVLWVGCKPHKPSTEEAPPPSVLPPIGMSDTNAFFPPIAPVSPLGGEREDSLPPLPGGVSSAPIPPPAPAPAPLPIGIPESSTGPVMPAPIPAPAPPVRMPITTSTVGGPPAPVSTPPARSASAGVHIVARGDTYYSIARDHDVTVAVLKSTNPGVDPRKLQLGQKIKVPASAPRAAGSPQAHDTSVYIVKSGDFLGRIASKHGTTVARLREVNGLNSDRIRVGQKLKLPPGTRR